MIDLLHLEPTRISKNLKGKFILLYGLPKVGKTEFLSKMPKSLILSFEPGTNALNNVYAVPIQTWSDFKAAISQLRLPALKEKFDVIGIDTADMAYELCIKQICSNNGVTQLGDIPYGQGYDLAKKEFSGALNELAFMGYGLAFTSHSTEKKLTNEKGEEFLQLAPAMPNRAYDIVNKLVDIIGYIRELPPVNPDERNVKIYLRGNDRFWAGSRFKYIEPVVDFSYESVANAIYSAIDKEISATTGGSIENQTSDEYNPYFKVSYSSLMDEAKQDWLDLTNANGENAQKILDKVDELMGTPGAHTKISAISEDKIEILQQVVDFMKNMSKGS